MVEALGLKASPQGPKPSQNGVSSGCEFNLGKIYYGFRRESTKYYGRLYSQIRDICAARRKFRTKQFAANIDEDRN